MFSAGLITFRETLEAALVVGIVLSILSKSNQLFYRKFVGGGILLGVFFSILIAFFLDMFFGGLTGPTEELFEGILMFVTAGFLSWMILWVHRQKDIVYNLKKRVTKHIEKGYGIGLLVLVATSVFREGTETVLYLKATSLVGSSNQLIGAAIGIVTAVIIGFLIFCWSLKIRLQTVFTITSVFLMLFAAGMVAHGVHEFQEVGLLPIFSFDPVFNISTVLNHKDTLGSMLRTLFGYTSKPTILELSSYFTYIAVILWIEKITSKLIKAKQAQS